MIKLFAVERPLFMNRALNIHLVSVNRALQSHFTLTVHIRNLECASHIIQVPGNGKSGKNRSYS